MNLGKIKRVFEGLAKECEDMDNCDEATKEKIRDTEAVIQISVNTVLSNIQAIREKYKNYLSKINFNDNRDVIPYISITHVLDNYIVPSIELALALEQEVEGVKQAIKN